MIPSRTITYVPSTQYKFLIKFDFNNGVFSIPPFTISVRIDPVYADYFTAADMAQVYTINIDSALLAKADKVKSLTFDEISGKNPPTLATKDMTKLFK